MYVKRLIIFVLLAHLLALPVIILEARNALKPAGPSALSQPLLTGRAFETASNKPPMVIVDQVAQKLLQQKIRETKPSTYDRCIRQVALRHGIPPALVKAVIQAESSFRPQVVSDKGAIGLMQLMPKSAEQAGARYLFIPHYNIQAGVEYLKKMLAAFDGNEVLAVAAYNTGPRKVKRYGGVPPFKETRIYVKRVLSYYRSF